MQQIVKDYITTSLHPGPIHKHKVYYMYSHILLTRTLMKTTQFGSSATCKALAPALSLVSAGELEINVSLVIIATMSVANLSIFSCGFWM